MMKFITDQWPGEPCLLTGNELEPLIITDAHDRELSRIRSDQPWTHHRLMQLGNDARLNIDPRESADAWLGTQWVGSTEI